MNSYTLAMIGNVLLTVVAFAVIFDPFDWLQNDDDDDDDAQDAFIPDVPDPVPDPTPDPDADPTSDPTPDPDPDPDQTLSLTGGDDAFTGGSGADTVFAGAGDDLVAGAAGTDRLFGGDGNDTLDGGAGDDGIEGNLGDDILLGGDGNDTLQGGGGTDRISGGDGDDILVSDRLDADAAFDRGGAELLSGGNGNDVVLMSSGDSASGGAGTDSFGLVVVGGEDAAVIEDFDTGSETLSIYYDPADFDDAPPEVSLSVDEDNDLTQVLLNGEEVLTLEGVQDLDPETVALLTEAERTA